MLRVEREHSVVRTNVLRTNVFLFKKKGGMNVMNVVVRETGPPCKATDFYIFLTSQRVQKYVFH